MPKKNLTTTGVLGLLFLSQVAVAGPFTIINRQSSLGSGPGEAELLAALNASADSMETLVNDGFLSEANRTTFAKGMSQANASNVTSLLFSPYADVPTFSLAVAGQGAYFSETGSTSQSANNSLPQMGAGAQASVVLGMRADKLGIQKLLGLDGNRLFLSVNGMGYSQTVQSVSFSMWNGGLNGRYKIVQPTGSVWAGWGGIDVGTGFNVTSNLATYAATLSQQTTATGLAGDDAVIDVNIAYELGNRSTVYTVPINFSTSVQVLYFLTLYGGAGADLNFGSSHMTGTASGPIATTNSSSIVTSNLFSGEASLDLDDGVSAAPSPFIGRGYIGAQFNLSALKLGVDYTMRSTSAWAIGGNVRFEF